jgi:hypothetical protein
MGFQRMPNEWCVYHRASDTGTTIFALHVDDIIITSSSLVETKRFKAELKSQWEISDLGLAKFTLGIAISRNRPTRAITISQTTFIDRILEKFNQIASHSCDTPMVTGLQLSRPDPTQPVTADIIQWMQRTPYRKLIGSLNYLAVATHPDIAFAVGKLASFLDCYCEAHWFAAIHVLCYVKGTRTLGLTLGGDASPQLIGFSDSDFGACRKTSRSVSGYCFSLGSGMISWSSKKQHHVTDSTCYAEYVTLYHTGKELIFLHELLDGLSFYSFISTPLHCNNDSACQLTGDPSNHANIKHFHVRYTFRDIVEEGLTHIVRILSTCNTADIFTKPLTKELFECFRSALGLRFI